MYSLVLAIIYVSFISLGLPDSMLGAGWPVMSAQFGVSISYAGVVSTIICACTIVSSLLSDKMTKKLGAGLVTAVSVGISAVSLIGFSITKSFAVLCILCIPYGFCAGAVDAALNNYVALHYSSRHMSWLHAFWGVGVSVSPNIMGLCLEKSLGWQSGYRIVGIFQTVLAIFIFLSLPLWKKREGLGKDTQKQSSKSYRELFSIKGVKMCLLCFFAYCALETTAGLYASSYFAQIKGISVDNAARLASFFFIGITLGRFLSGFVADRLGDKRMIKLGIFVVIFGTVLVLLPLKTSIFAAAGLIISGFGCAPIYPCIIHSTPTNFGAENSQALIGIQMASAYIGSTLAPLVFGYLAQFVSLKLYPVYLILFALLMMVSNSLMNKRQN